MVMNNQPVINHHTMLGPSMTMAGADKIIMIKVKTMLAHGETLDRLLGDNVQADMIGDFPGIGFFLP